MMPISVVGGTMRTQTLFLVNGQVKDVAVLKEKIVEGNKGEPRKEYEVVAV